MSSDVPFFPEEKAGNARVDHQNKIGVLEKAHKLTAEEFCFRLFLVEKKNVKNGLVINFKNLNMHLQRKISDGNVEQGESNANKMLIHDVNGLARRLHPCPVRKRRESRFFALCVRRSGVQG